MERRVLTISGIVFIFSTMAWFFLPYTYGFLDQETQSLLSYGGHGAILQNEVFNEFVSWFLFLGSSLTALGTVLRRKLFRTSFAILVICWLFLSPLWGMGIETAGGYFLACLSNLAAGMLIATAYFSRVSYEFY